MPDSECKHSQVSLEKAHLTIEKEGKTLHIENAPVLVCDRCGERFLNEAVVADISKALNIIFSPDSQIRIQKD